MSLPVNIDLSNSQSINESLRSSASTQIQNSRQQISAEIRQKNINNVTEILVKEFI